MERNKEARRASIVGSNGFNRRNCRTNTLRDSPDEDSGVELQESTKSRDRLKKDRDRESERDRGRDIKERDRYLRERFGRSKRRRAERMTSNRDNIVRDETSDESENEDLDDETTTSTTSAVTGVRFLPTAVGSVSNNHHSHNHSSSLREHQHNSCNGNINNIISGNHHLQHRKNFPPVPSSSKSYRAAPAWKAGDEMIGISVPRKARSASTKRLHDLASNSSHNNIGGGGCGVTGGDQILRQASAPPMSPSSSNASTRRKLKPNCANGNGTKPTPPKVMSKPSSSNPEELEIEIAEVLYGLMNQSQAPSSKNEDSREVSRSKSRASLSNPNSTSANNPISGPNSTPLSAVAPKRKKPRQILENSSRISLKREMDQTPKSGSTAENVYEIGGNLVNSQVHPGHSPEEPESMNLDPESKPVMAELLKERRDLVATEETSSPKEKESPAARTEDSNRVDSASIATASVSATEIKENPEIENVRQEKFQIDLMASPPQVRSSPKRDTVISSAAAVVDEMPILSVLDIEFLKDKENVNGKRWREESVNVAAEVKKGKAESEMGIENKVRNIDLIKLELENGERDGVGRVNATGLNSNKEDVEPLTEKTGQSTNSLPLPMSMASWPGGLPSMGYMAPLQSVAPMDGATVTPTPLQSFAQPRPKKCATHCYIARNTHSLQQFMKMNPFWPAAAGPTTLFGSKPCALSVVPNADVQNVSVRGVLNGHGQDKGQSVGNAPVHGGGGKEKGSQTASSHDYDSVQNTQQQQQIPIQQALPPVPPSSPLAPAFIFPLNQQAMAAAVSAQPAVKSPSGPTTATSSNLSNSATSSAPTAPTTAMSFNYPNIPINETQYLAILQNNGYPFTMPPTGAPSNYRGTPAQAMPMLSSPFYPSQMIHPSQIQPPSTQSHQNASVSASQKNSQSTENFRSKKSQISQNELNHHMKQPRHVESEPGSDDSRNLRNIYGHNFTMSQNFSLLSGGGNQSEKKPEQPHQAPHSFAMTFGSMNGSMGIDVTTIAQNHAFFQRFPEASRKNMQMMMAAAPKKSSSSKDDERKNSSAKSQPRSELADAPNGVIECPTRSPNVASGTAPNVASGPAWSSQTTTGNGGGSINATNTHIQSQLQQQQKLQLKQHQQQQHQKNNWNKTQATSNGSLYSENLNSSSTMAAKFPNSLSGFTQNLVQNSNNTRNAPTSQAPSSFASSTASNLKNLPQQHNSQIQSQLPAQISFGGNHKCSKNSQGNQTTLNNQACSPTTSSMSKGASGSPRTTDSASTNNKMGQASAFSAQQAQNSQAQKSLSNSGAKPQSQQMAKNMQQAQLYCAFSQAQSHSTGSNSGPGGYFAQQSRRPDQPPGGPGPSVNGMLSLGSMGTNDPAKAIAAAICNLKGSGLSSSQAQSMIHAQFSALPAGFTYVHPVSTAVQMKHAEQKQPAGQPEKK